jgi:hypothetical protein
VAEAHTDLGGRCRIEAVQVEVIGMIHIAEIQDVAVDRQGGRWIIRGIRRVDDSDLPRRRCGSICDRHLGDHRGHAELEAGGGAERKGVVGVGE